MTKTPQEIIIAALVAKLGGEVHISMREYEDAEEFELYRMDDPASFAAGMGFKVRSQAKIGRPELPGPLSPNPYRSEGG